MKRSTMRRPNGAPPRRPSSASVTRRRVRALGGVDPRGLPPATPYPCTDPRLGERVAGDDFAGTVVACATPPPGRRGAHFAVGTITSGSAIGRAWKRRAARAEALAARYEGADFDARPRRRAGPARRREHAADTRREALALPAPAPASEVYSGEVVDLGAAPTHAAWIDPRKAPTWGGRAVTVARDVELARYRIPRDGHDPRGLPSLALVNERDPAAGFFRKTMPRGASIPSAGPPLVVSAAALESIRQALVAQPSRFLQAVGEPMADAIRGALSTVARRESPAPGTHLALALPYHDRYTRSSLTSRPTLPLGRPLPFVVDFGDSRRPARLLARVVRFADGQTGALIEPARPGEAAAPAWGPGVAPPVHPERELTPAQRAVVARTEVTSAQYLPLRVDLHPDGRMRLVHVAIPVSRELLRADDKPATPGTERASVYGPRGTLLGYEAATPDPLWRPVADLRFAPDPAAAAKPTLTSSSDDAVDRSGYKARGRVIEVKRAHLIVVANALRTGRPVAPEVVAEYPALAEFYAASLRTGKSRAEVAAEEAAAQRALDWADDPDVTVHWSVKEGLLLYTRGKVQKIVDAIRALRGTVAGFKWSRNLGAWFRPQSVGVSVSTTNIDAVARELRRAGLVVRVERGDSDVVLGEANERRQDHKLWRADLYADRAGAAVERGGGYEAKADAIRADIPVGAPTRRAERAEARAERAEGKAEGEYAYAEHAAGVAENLARTAAGYDVTAEITRKQAERRADAFADLFVRRAKGRTGAVRLTSDKTDNLSEYRVSWGVVYPATARRAALVSYDGRSVLVLSVPADEAEWSPYSVGRVAKIALSRPDTRGVVLREDVTRLDAEAIFEKVVAALPTAKLAELGDRVPDDPTAYQVELSEYGRTRVPEAVTAAFASPQGWFTTLRRAYLERGSVRLPLRFSEEARDGSESGKRVELAHVDGMRFRIVGRLPEDGQERTPGYLRRTRIVGDVEVDLAGVPIAQAWALFVGHAVSMVSGGAVSSIDFESMDDDGARRPSSPERWKILLAHYATRRVATAFGKAFPLGSRDRWTAERESVERVRPPPPNSMFQYRQRLPGDVVHFRVMRGQGNNAFAIGGFPNIELDVQAEGAVIRRVDEVEQEFSSGSRGRVSIEGPSVPLVLDGLTVAQGWDLVVAHATALLSGKPVVLPKPPRAERRPKGSTLTAREDPRLAAMRGPAVREGTGVVEALPRDAADAAARGRVAEVSARVAPVAADAAARREALTGSAREAHAELLAAARGAGNSLGFYPTAPSLAEHLAELAGVAAGARVLEPSAGMGGLLEPLAARGARVTAIEFQADRAAYLAAAWRERGVDVRVGDFLTVPPTGDFDAVVMNPPFSVEGRRYTDAEHVLHAMGFVRPGGHLVAIMSPETPRRSDKKSTELRERLAGWSARWEAVDPGRFRMSGTDIPVVILVARRPA